MLRSWIWGPAPKTFVSFVEPHVHGMSLVALSGRSPEGLNAETINVLSGLVGRKIALEEVCGELGGSNTKDRPTEPKGGFEMLQRLGVFFVLALFTVPVLGAQGLVTDEILVQYPEGYTKFLVADLAKLVGQAELQSGLLGPLAGANHPLAGIQRVLTLLKLDLTAVQYVAYGTGPGLSPFSLIKGLDPAVILGDLMGLQYAAEAPGSPYENWSLETIHGVPVVFTGGKFGPVRMQWAYVVAGPDFWVGTEVSFTGQPDQQRLRTSTETIIDKMAGKGGCFCELFTAMAVRGGDLSFVRKSAPAVDRPLEAGEQVMGYAVLFQDGKATVHFDTRFASVSQAKEAKERIIDGTSAYLAQDLYRGDLLDITQLRRDLNFDVSSDLPGIIGLLMVTIPM